MPQLCPWLSRKSCPQGAPSLKPLAVCVPLHVRPLHLPSFLLLWGPAGRSCFAAEKVGRQPD